ncbi:MAG: hypothetical protein KC609_24620, partial [Myxococcales bacterium]|nr:hypothetical protein [Myxococcales bacterium]
MRRARFCLIVALVLGFASACDRPMPALSGPILDNFGVTETEGSQECDNLDPSHCLFPFPSDYYLQEGPNGRQMVFGANTLPKNTAGDSMDPKYYREYDGFSPISPIMFRFPTATLDGAVDQFHIGDSLLASSKTLVIEA